MYARVENIIHGKLYQNLCRIPYYNYPKGCPNYGKRQDCPSCELVSDRFDLSKPIYVIYTEFPVGAFAERMRACHPEWSDHHDNGITASDGRERLVNTIKKMFWSFKKNFLS